MKSRGHHNLKYKHWYEDIQYMVFTAYLYSRRDGSEWHATLGRKMGIKKKHGVNTGKRYKARINMHVIRIPQDQGGKSSVQRVNG